MQRRPWRSHLRPEERAHIDLAERLLALVDGVIASTPAEGREPLMSRRAALREDIARIKNRACARARYAAGERQVSRRARAAQGPTA